MPVSELCHGGVGKAIGRTEDGNPRSNKPAAIIMSDDYRGYAESDEDFALYFEVVERMNCDDGTRLAMCEVFGSGYRPVDDGFDPELD